MATTPRPTIATTHPHVVAWLVDPADAHRYSAGTSRRVGFHCTRGHQWEARPGDVLRVPRQSPPCPYCAGKRAWRGHTDAATTHPDLTRYFTDPADARTHMAGARARVDFTCPDCHHQWNGPVLETVGKERGCPRCPKMTSPAATTHPHIVAHFTDPADAQRVTVQTRKKISFTHPNCRHVFTARPNSYLTNPQCRVCDFGAAVIVGETDTATTHPHRVHLFTDAADAQRYKAASGQETNFTCRDGHTWRAAVATVISQNKGCPTCAGRWPDPIAITHPHIAARLTTQEQQLTAGSTATVQQVCERNHVWHVELHRLVNGADCPICYPSGGYREDREGHLYIITGHIDGHAAAKTGITNQPAQRFAALATVGLTDVAHVITGPGCDIRQLETAIKHDVTRRGITTLNRLGHTFAGASETFYLDQPAARAHLDELLEEIRGN